MEGYEYDIFKSEITKQWIIIIIINEHYMSIMSKI